ncbi:unnamed protein product [Spirodela intermedia]|uniref:Uncharacterized protein n=2 Tax=Spirodela intermedia TaxID=51605 RepID=A0A7I8K629_SPIIN|nr:unnamed protein product [Spirodela intermedia]CAA6656542.1 unnamed protein product [Spirodela intermedia]CAA7392128.1 unnamed protein product [Spirodela intermedia]
MIWLSKNLGISSPTLMPIYLIIRI